MVDGEFIPRIGNRTIVNRYVRDGVNDCDTNPALKRRATIDLSLCDVI